MKKIDKNIYFVKTNDANLSAYKNIYIPEVKLMVSQGKITPAQHTLDIETKVYATTAYRKLTSKNNTQYTLVYVRQKSTLQKQVVFSLAEINTKKKGLTAINFFPIISGEKVAHLHLVVETETTDVISSKVLTRSVSVIVDKEINTNSLEFKDLQESIDAWLKQN